MTVKAIVWRVSDYLKIPAEDILNTKCRRPDVVAARRLAWATMIESGLKKLEIAQKFGCDHTSVGYALKYLEPFEREQAKILADGMMPVNSNEWIGVGWDAEERAGGEGAWLKAESSLDQHDPHFYHACNVKVAFRDVRFNCHFVSYQHNREYKWKRDYQEVS